MPNTAQTDDHDPLRHPKTFGTEPERPALEKRQPRATPPPMKHLEAANDLEPLLILDDDPGVGALFRRRPSRSSRQQTVMSCEDAEDDGSPLIIIEPERQRFF